MMAQKEKAPDSGNVIKKKITTRDLEKLEVARLSCDIEPRSKPSDIFEKLQEKRRIRHENILQQLAKSLHEVNMKTEKNITLSSLELKAQTNEFQAELNAILEGIDTSEVASYCASVFIGFQSKSNAIKAEQQKVVNEFYDDLISFENNRAKENAKLLHLACEEIRKVGYFLPYDVQAFVEEETLKMNQLSLCNRRCYEDLKLTLTLITEQTFKSFMERVFCIREKWIQYKAQENCYHAVHETEERPSGGEPKTYTRLELKGEELPLIIRSNSMYCSCKAEDWIKNVEKNLSTLVDFGKNLTILYKNTIKAIYNGFTPEIGKIKTAMSMIDRIVIEERVIYPLVIGVQNFHAKDVEELEIHWQNTLEEVRNLLRYVNDYVRDLGNLWERHVERLCESKKLIWKALEKAEQNNQLILQELEVQLNVNLDALRQEHVLSKLEKDYEAVVATLEDIKAKYESMYLEDVFILQDFYNFMDLEGDVLSADIQEHLYESNTVKFMHSYSGQFRLLREKEIEGKSIFKEMKKCSQKIQNLRFWKQGVWAALDTVSGRIRETLRPRAEKWIKNKIAFLAEKKSVQLELLDRRFQRIKVEIYERRMQEVMAHQEMFDKHKEKIGVTLKKANEEFENLIIKHLKTINYVRENLMEIEDSAKVENLPGVLRGNQKMLERKKEELETDIQTDFERFRANCETRMSDAQQINVNFMKSIKLFHENGNYSIEEGKAVINLLEAIDKEIGTELKSILKDSSKAEGEMIKKVSEMFNPVVALFDLLYEETLFNQEIQQRLQNFTNNIQESVKVLKVDSDFFNEHYYCISKNMENPNGSLNSSEEQLWNFLIQLLYKNVNNLLYPLNLPESLAQREEEEDEEGKEASVEGELTGPCCCAGKYPVNITNSKVFVFRKSEKPALPCKNFGSELFRCEIPRGDDGTFMAIMCKNFSEELDFLQQAACNFYKKIQGRKIVREDLLPDNYDSFIQRILKKFNHYNVQIQELWLQIIMNFLRGLGEIKLLANKFIRKKLEDYKDSALTALKNYEDGIRDCVEHQNRDNSRELEDLDNKLLPLHGYPDNAHLLRELEEAVVRTTASQTVRWEAALKNFKSQLKCFRVHHVQDRLEIKKIELQYTKLRDTIFVEELGQNLLDELLNICNNGGFCIKKFSKDNVSLNKQVENESQTFANEDIPEEDELHIIPEKLHSLQSNIEKLKQIVERERFSGMQLPTCTTSPAESYNSLLAGSMLFNQPKLNILLEIIDFQDGAFGATDGLQKYIRYLKTYIESQEKFHKEELFKWLNRWKLNVKKILKLYRVKNEQNPCIVKEKKW